MSESDVVKMKVADLKRELKLRGLPITGNKNELQDRLSNALLDGEISLEDASGELDEAILTDEDEGILGPDENELLKSPTSLEPTVDANDEVAEADTKPTKVVLKRPHAINSNNVTSSSEDNITNINENADTSSPVKMMKKGLHTPITMSDTVTTTEDKKVECEKPNAISKLNEMTAAERLANRAKKFGIASGASQPQSDEKEQKQLDILKKRAERFGCVTSSKMVEISDKEKLLKRQERFGTSNKNTIKSIGPVPVLNSTNGSDEYAEKARLRLERFKNTTEAVAVKKDEPVTTSGEVKEE
ncbi:SAP domain-containing ribonucleoprotein [Teleopsis dalmanni]|uniref:SAP domain-containing ribonucleoprotein-like n=1 Tax=Teleopsis dalmanni TaxID=139649 RepID=UPI0018CF9324|nr:SAP domain-containing ribonucleoprotein-like [Teleopsis dalmanni]XP_037954439.1 SAP domain-containing ribonucleoprotein [Teleopsis dalmanni]